MLLDGHKVSRIPQLGSSKGFPAQKNPIIIGFCLRQTSSEVHRERHMTECWSLGRGLKKLCFWSYLKFDRREYLSRFDIFCSILERELSSVSEKSRCLTSRFSQDFGDIFPRSFENLKIRSSGSDKGHGIESGGILQLQFLIFLPISVKDVLSGENVRILRFYSNRGFLSDLVKNLIDCLVSPCMCKASGTGSDVDNASVNRYTITVDQHSRHVYQYAAGNRCTSCARPKTPLAACGVQVLHSNSPPRSTVATESESHVIFSLWNCVLCLMPQSWMMSGISSFTRSFWVPANHNCDAAHSVLNRGIESQNRATDNYS
ncbi:hypothetical protein J6590_027736 [Homalodisca vitripennis]|nr:hypothetical protein J6590_027736 [Homalodisca vitripennis]